VILTTKLRIKDIPSYLGPRNLLENAQIGQLAAAKNIDNVLVAGKVTRKPPRFLVFCRKFYIVSLSSLIIKSINSRLKP
jgi:hypothetical protein